MRRFPRRDPPPRDRPPRRDLPRPEGPLDRLLRGRTERDPAPFIIGGTVVFLAVVILLVLLVGGVFGGDGDGGSTETVGDSGVQARFGEMPPLPPGLVAVSDFLEFDSEDELSATIALPLRGEPSDETTIGFYTYRDSRWQRLADVRLEDGGTRAQADFAPLPPNLAVLRVVAQAYQVAASLPPGGSLHPDAGVNIVSPRDYKPRADGSLEGTATEVVGDEDLLVIPTIVGSSEDTAAVVNDILADDSLRGQHVQEIVRLAESGGFDGVDLEYPDVDPELGAEFTSLAEELGRALREDGRRLSLTLPPPGPQREAYDWPALGEAADMIKVLPIADPVEYWKTMPEAMDQLVEDVDPGKLMLVVSPFSAEVTEDGGLTTLGYLEAMLVASEIRVREPADPENIEPDTDVRVVAVNQAQSEGGTNLEWDDEAVALSFSYGAPDRRTVYVENVFSVGFKLEIVQAYRLGGVSVTDGSAETDVANVWPTIQRLVESGTVSLLRPNPDALVPRWEAPDGGRLDAEVGPAVVWRADEAGAYKLRMLISDGEQRFGREVEVEVQEEEEEPTPAPSPFVTFPAESPTSTATPTPEATATPTPEPEPTPTPTGTPGPKPPDPPTGVDVDNSTSGQFGISWDNAPRADKYNVYARREDVEFPELVATVSATQFIDSVFNPEDAGKTYCYFVTAENEGGVSEGSEEVCAELQ